MKPLHLREACSLGRTWNGRLHYIWSNQIMKTTWVVTEHLGTVMCRHNFGNLDEGITENNRNTTGYIQSRV